MNNRRSNGNKNKLLYDPNQAYLRRLGAFSNTQNFSTDEDLDDETNEELESNNGLDNSVNDDSLPSSNPLDEPKESEEGNVSSSAGLLGKKAGKEAKAVATKASAKIATVIAANPWILAVGGVLILLFFLILFISASGNGEGHFDEKCNYNQTTINLKTCNSEDSTSVSLKDYVIGVTNLLTKDGEYSNEALKALMIMVKTNALALGGYNSTSKNINLDTCTYNYENVSDDKNKLSEVYEDIENYLYLPADYKDVVTDVTSDVYLPINQNMLNYLSSVKNGSFSSLLGDIYSGKIVSQTNNKKIFIGDSRVHGMKNAGVIDVGESVYEDGQGYTWFVNTAIESASKIMNASEGYDIYIWLGINDFSTDYVAKYAELAKGAWSKNNIYVMSVGPVDESKSEITNEKINQYNQSIASLVSSQNLSNLKYYNVSYNITNYDSMGLHYSDADYKAIYNSMFGSVKASGKKYKLYDLATYCEFIENQDSGEYCSTSGDGANLISFLNEFEGHEGLCNNGKGYLAANNGADYQITIGHGLIAGDFSYPSVVEYINANNYGSYFSKSGSGYTVYSGACVPIDIIDKIQELTIEKDYTPSIDAAAEKYGVTLTPFQRDALIDFNYNLGTAYINSLMEAYAKGGYEGLWSKLKLYVRSENGAVLDALKKRRKAEFYLFVTGDYTDQNRFYSRSLDNYDNYDSEGVMSQKVSCENTSATNSANCTIFAQGDSRWGNINLGTSSSTMHGSGCAVTSLAIGISCSGTKLTVSNFDAGVLIKTLNKSGSCFTSGGGIYWDCDAIRTLAPNVHNIYNHTGFGSNNEKIAIINQYNVGNQFVLVHFVNGNHPRGHYVVVTSVSGNNLVTKDPAGGVVSTISVSDVDQILAYSS